MNDDVAYWIGLTAFSKFGPRRMSKLQAAFPTMKEAFFASKEELINAGIPENIAAGFVHLRSEIHPERTLELAAREQIRIITLADEEYPALLKLIYDPPPVLYVKGYLPPDEAPHLAVVGSRKFSPYGQEAVRALVGPIAEQGVVIVSGLAYGVDEASHVATLQRQGITVAVLGCGLLKIENRSKYLASKIVEEGGAIVSEFPLEMHGLKGNFPIRNRVIAGMSHGTLVIEAQIKSGSLITAKSALEQGREVFAVPGSIFSETSAGTNWLIKQGAHPATSVEDILTAINVEQKLRMPRQQFIPESPEEAAILETLTSSPIHIDEITRVTNLPSSTITATLSMMELRGRARHVGGQYYVLGG